MKFFDIERSKKGIPCMWECGGGSSNIGNSTIICDMNGLPKKPLYIRTRGSLSNEDHALIPVREKDIVIETYHHRHDFTIKIYQITKISENTAETEEINSFDYDEWDYPLEKLENAVNAAMDKATCYHCRHAFYIKED